MITANQIVIDESYGRAEESVAEVKNSMRKVSKKTIPAHRRRKENILIVCV